MRKILAVVFSLILAVSAFAETVQIKNKKHQRAYQATLALYGESAQYGVTNVLCTAWPYKKISDGYLLITAGHCFGKLPDDVKFYVSDDIHKPVKLASVTLLRFVRTDKIDAAELEFKTTKEYPVLELEARTPEVDEPVFISGFSDAISKQIHVGRVTGPRMETKGSDEECTICEGRYPIEISGGPGGSGSAVISEKTGKVIGTLEGIHGNSVVGVMPADKILEWLNTKP